MNAKAPIHLQSIPDHGIQHHSNDPAVCLCWKDEQLSNMEAHGIAQVDKAGIHVEKLQGKS